MSAISEYPLLIATLASVMLLAGCAQPGRPASPRRAPTMDVSIVVNVEIYDPDEIPAEEEAPVLAEAPVAGQPPLALGVPVAEASPVQSVVPATADPRHLQQRRSLLNGPPARPQWPALEWRSSIIRRPSRQPR